MTTQETIPGPTDERDEREQLSMFARAGQLALPGAAAQLGLDGVAYALDPQPREIEASATAEASRSLGTTTTFDLGPGEGGLPSTEGPAPNPNQLSFAAIAIDRDRWEAEATPQLAIWSRLGERRSMTQYTEFDRDGACLIARVNSKTDAYAHRNERGTWITRNTIRCHQYHTCPYCGPQKCRETASLLRVCFDRHLAADPYHDVWMLTLEVPHYSTTRTELVVDQLYDSCAQFWRSKEWKRFADRWGVIGRPRVLDVTHGGTNGSHPHFHIAVFATKAGISTDHAFLLGDPTDNSHTVDERGTIDCNGVRVMPTMLVQLADEQERWGPYKPLRACNKTVRQRYLDEIKGSLITAWERVVLARGVEIRQLGNFRAHALALTPAEHAAAYFTKWGLADEIGMSSAKDRGSMRLLDLVGARVPGAAWIWKQWRRAVVGHALVTGMADICKRLGVTDDDARAWLAEQKRRREAEAEREGTPIKKVRELNVVLRAHLYESALHVGLPNVFAYLDKLETDHPGCAEGWIQLQLDDFLWRNMPVARGSPDG